MRSLCFAATFSLLSATPAFASDGKWTPEQVMKLNPAWLKREGLKLSPKQLWDEKRGTGLAAGAVNVGGCSGAFIAPDGLVITNHHCVFPIIQEHTTPARNLLRDGFLARTRGEELPGKGSRIQIPKSFTDVTREVLAAVPEGADDLARYKAIDKKQKELQLECEKKPAARCQVAAFDGGLQYMLIEAVELSDVRLVYAPPISVGEYGGEVDNWSWPRHTGDFGIIRAYVAPDGKPAKYAAENIPHKADFFFPISTAGLKADEFVMILGYPGRTERALLAEEMLVREQKYFPKMVEISGEYIQIIEAITDPEGKIALASTLKSLHNRRKNAQGQLEGLARGKIIDKTKLAEESAVEAAKKNQQPGAKALVAREELLGVISERTKRFDRELLLANLGSKAFPLAATIARLSTEREKPDLDRDPAFMDRELPRLSDAIEREQKNIFVPADQKLALAWLRRVAALPADQRIAGIDKIFGATWNEAEATRKVGELYAGTKLLSLDQRKAMIGKRPAELHALKDPLLELGFVLAAELDRQKEIEDRRSGAFSRLRPEWRKLVLAQSKTPIAPDANGTLRISFGRVRGYSPKDGVMMTPFTTLAGMLAKDTGVAPFALDPRVKAAAQSASGSEPVCFLSDVDTTGGNSGSPMINGKGELVGVNFDRVWENVANDYGYNPDIARNISADVRFVLWMLEKVEKADELLAEIRGAKRAK